jgi:hypothetical protein
VNQTACPVCQGPATLFDVVDFNRTCPAPGLSQPPLSGIPIYYSRCGDCGFLFAEEMHRWPVERFMERVYNDDYVLYDPEYVQVRPAANADFLLTHFPGGSFTHLDYGGGNGLLSRTMREGGWPSVSYDPLIDAERPEGPFDFVTSFEVFEHVPDVHRLMRDLAALTGDSSVILFSTATSDGVVTPGARLTWDYAGPRNGHISLFSQRSLKVLAQQYGYAFGSFNNNIHCFVRTVPGWASHLINMV